MATRQPDARIPRVHRRLSATSGSSLGVGDALTNAQNHYHTFPVAGAARVRVRFKATKAGALKLFFVGPDYDPDKADATHATANGTQYSTGNPDDTAVVADTEAMIETDCYGEGYARVSFVPSAADGVVTYCDISQV